MKMPALQINYTWEKEREGRGRAKNKDISPSDTIQDIASLTRVQLRLTKKIRHMVSKHRVKIARKYLKDLHILRIQRSNIPKIQTSSNHCLHSTVIQKLFFSTIIRSKSITCC